MLYVTDLTVSGYRSIRKIWFPVDRVGVFVGENGTGKSNLYRCLQLLRAAATGTLSSDVAAEGGMESVTWAGERRPSDDRGIKLEAEIAAPEAGGYYRYAVEFVAHEVYRKGHEDDPVADGFPGEPRIVAESLDFLFRGRKTAIVERTNRSGWAIDDSGKRHLLSSDMMGGETALSFISDAAAFPDVAAVRSALSAWRFYHGFRSDPASPLRLPGVPASSPCLDVDGANLAAVLATSIHLRGSGKALRDAVADAFPGMGLKVQLPSGKAQFGMTVEGLNRPLSASELSEGQLRYVALAGALLCHRPPPFIALNEPETSLHPDVLPALGRMIAKAAERSQIWLVTHSTALAETIAQAAEVPVRRVVKREGATWIEGLRQSGFDADAVDDGAQT